MTEETVWPRRVFMMKPAAMGKTEFFVDLDVSFPEAILPSDLMTGEDRFWREVAEANEARARWYEDCLWRLSQEGAKSEEIVVEHHQGGVTAIVWRGVQRYRFKATFDVPYAEAGL